MKDRFNPQSQDPDEPGDRHSDNLGQRIMGKGAQGGGSQMSKNNTGAGNATGRPTKVSGSGSAPRMTQKIRG